MNLGFYNIDDYLTFTCNTHNPATGGMVDADSVPAYRIYEDETLITSGTMSLLDSTNTTGFYSKKIQLASLDGFEVGKSYTILIQATVGGVSGAIAHTFGLKDIPSEVWENSTRTLTQTAAEVADALVGGKITIYRDVDFEVEFSGFSDLSDYDKLWFTVKNSVSVADTSSIVQIEITDGLLRISGAVPEEGTESNGEISINVSNVTVSLAAASTALLVPATHLYYDLKILRDSGAIEILTMGSAQILPAITRSIE